MDIPSFDASNNRLYIDDTTTISVEKTVDQFEGRSIDNNFVATYFPDVFSLETSGHGGKELASWRGGLRC